jgi:hypothetical protein
MGMAAKELDLSFSKARLLQPGTGITSARGSGRSSRFGCRLCGGFSVAKKLAVREPP